MSAAALRRKEASEASGTGWVGMQRKSGVGYASSGRRGGAGGGHERGRLDRR